LLNMNRGYGMIAHVGDSFNIPAMQPPSLACRLEEFRVVVSLYVYTCGGHFSL
jgi:hypothetical protein